MTAIVPPPVRIEVIGLDAATALRARVLRRLRAALSGFPVRPIRAEVRFVDDNGPKGGLDARCALTVRLPYRPAIQVERRGLAPQEAFDLALPVLERQLDRYRERQRQSRRRPKKYFAARRLLEA